MFLKAFLGRVALTVLKALKRDFSPVSSSDFETPAVGGTVAALKTPDKDRAKPSKDRRRNFGNTAGHREAMADIFISYARADQETAKTLAQALADQG